MNPWFSYTRKQTPETVTIIGGGLAGVSIAYMLASHGIKVQIIERQEDLAKETSGNPLAVTMPLMGHGNDPLVEYYALGFSLIRELAIKAGLWQDIGVLKTLGHTVKKVAYDVVDAKIASEILGVEINDACYWMPSAGVVSPYALCCYMLESHPDCIKLLKNKEAIKFIYNNGMYRVLDVKGDVISEAQTLIIANNADAKQLLPMEYPLIPTRGQLTYLEDEELPKLKSVLCYEGGYVAPMADGAWCVGATYNRDIISTSVMDVDHQENLDNLQKHVLLNISSIKAKGCAGRAGIRLVSPDRRPLIGPIPDESFYQSTYGDLHYGKPANHYPNAQYHPGLFMSLAHGSRGVTSCMVSAKHIASLLCKEVDALSPKLHEILHPARFIIRSFRQKP